MACRCPFGSVIWPGFIFITLLLNACATVPVPPETSATQQQWQQRLAQVSALADWSATGRIAIRKEEEGWSASYEWQQVGAQQYTINIRGPLGFGVLQIRGADGYAELIQAGKPPYKAQNADQLLVEQTGWQLPVNGLRYWIRGLPVPGEDDRHVLNENAAPRELEQGSWLIRYSRYKLVDGVWLPGKLTLVNADLQVKLLVDQWQLPTR